MPLLNSTTSEKFKTRSKSVIEMNKFLISDENYESGDALSQLVRQVDESVHSSSCDECEDGEFNNTLEVSKPSLPDTTDNIDVTLSNCSEINALMNEDDNKGISNHWENNHKILVAQQVTIAVKHYSQIINN